MIALETDKLTISKGGKTLIHPLTTQFHGHQLTVLLGPNGAGKSTLLKALCKDETYQGKIQCFGQPHDKWARQDLAKHMGVLPQHSNLSFNFTVEEVVKLGTLPLKADKETQNRWVEQRLLETGLSHLAHRSYPLLSGGEKQRVHLARVLVQLSQSQEKTLLLLDEPTSALDIEHQHNTLTLAKCQAEQGACVIVVLHDLNLAAQYADRIILLQNGRVLSDGTPWATLTRERIESLYRVPCQIHSHSTRHHPVIISA